ncbi:MAG: hypothetical protein ACP5MT_00565 [Candidatus Acidifodinimicrobium sp.]
MDDLLRLVYGTHPKSVRLYPEARKVIDYLREKGSVKRDELANLLGTDLNSSAGKKHFYTIISPMFDKILVSERNGKEVYYHLSYDLFRVYIDGIRRKSKYYLLSNPEKEGDESEEHEQ